MEQENRPSDAVTQEADVTSGEGEKEKVDTKPTQAQKPSALSLEQINELTGRSYKTLEEAQKGVQETYSHVGKRTEKIEESLKEKDFMSRDEVEDILFMNRHPEYESYDGLLSAIAKANNVTKREAAQTDDFKTVFEKAQGFDAVQKKDTVLQSKSRLASDSSYQKEFQKAQETGNWGDFVLNNFMKRGE